MGFVIISYVALIGYEIKNLEYVRTIEAGSPALIQATATKTQRLAVRLAEDSRIRDLLLEASRADGMKAAHTRRMLLHDMQHVWGPMSRPPFSLNIQFSGGTGTDQFS